MFILGWVGPVAVQCGSVRFMRFSAVHAVHAVGCGWVRFSAVGCGSGFSITPQICKNIYLFLVFINYCMLVCQTYVLHIHTCINIVSVCI